MDITLLIKRQDNPHQSLPFLKKVGGMIVDVFLSSEIATLDGGGDYILNDVIAPSYPLGFVHIKGFPDLDFNTVKKRLTETINDPLGDANGEIEDAPIRMRKLYLKLSSVPQNIIDSLTTDKQVTLNYSPQLRSYIKKVNINQASKLDLQQDTEEEAQETDFT